MLRKYLLIAIRSLRRHTAVSMINIIGLSVSMSVTLLLILFVRGQDSIDEFHANSDRLYRIYSEYQAPSAGGVNEYATSPAELGDFVSDEIPGIERVVRLRRGFEGTATSNGIGLPISGIFADSSFFEVFSFSLASGDESSALSSPRSVILSRAMAVRFFGSVNPIGGVLSLAEKGDFTVTGILEDPEGETHLALDAIASFYTYGQFPQYDQIDADWTRSVNMWYTFALLEKGNDKASVQRGLDSIVADHFKPRNEAVLQGLQMQNIGEISLGKMLNNEMGTVIPALFVWMLSVLGGLILITACFNYVGLTISRSLKRAREVGVRKSFGAHRREIVLQFVIEALVVSTFAMILALTYLAWLIPGFNSLQFALETGARVKLDFFQDPFLAVVFAFFTVSIAVVAGMYPAIHLSKYSPASVMKAKSLPSSGGGSKFRKGLVIGQFSISLLFIVVTLVLFKQANYMQHADYGFEQDEVINVNLFSVPYAQFRQEIVQSPHVEEVSGIDILPALGSFNTVWVKRSPDEERWRSYVEHVDEHFLDVLGIKLLAGRQFLESDELIATPNNSAHNIMVNQTFVRNMMVDDPNDAIGQTLTTDDSTLVTVVGVFTDFHVTEFMEPIPPLIQHLSPGAARWANVRVVAGHSAEAKTDIDRAWDEIGFERAAEYDVFSAQLENSFVNQILGDIIRVIGLISVLAIIIACLGLLGIASHNVESRTKEISIRKVLGASVASIVSLLSKEFFILISIASLFALPVAWLASNQILQMFANRVDLGVGTFAVGILAILILVTLAIGSQTMRAAIQNPVANLMDD